MLFTKYTPLSQDTFLFPLATTNGSVLEALLKVSDPRQCLSVWVSLLINPGLDDTGCQHASTLSAIHAPLHPLIPYSEVALRTPLYPPATQYTKFMIQLLFYFH